MFESSLGQTRSRVKSPPGEWACAKIGILCIAAAAFGTSNSTASTRESTCRLGRRGKQIVIPHYQLNPTPRGSPRAMPVMKDQASARSAVTCFQCQPSRQGRLRAGPDSVRGGRAGVLWDLRIRPCVEPVCRPHRRTRSPTGWSRGRRSTCRLPRPSASGGGPRPLPNP